ncbi:unnamed protein product [Fraxinus pennsylvanica]|uniref:Uncharacterized protein n=1 Tax=Fraxinus pennsylvanica TaxID=56036 RepID=A0AAD1ZTQ8_9LAMI|nr:unnamed protein product [Fraxinus pennsylvanica]
MAETRRSNPKQRGPFSPSSPFLLGSNDEKLRCAQARAAHTVTMHWKPGALTIAISPKVDPLLGKEQILELFQNCIKLASENVFLFFLLLFFVTFEKFDYELVYDIYGFAANRLLL